MRITYYNGSTDAYSGQVNMEAAIYVDGDIVGAAEYVLFDDELTISDIQIKPEWRRKGMGSRLMKYIKEQNPEYKYVPSLKTELGSEFVHKDLPLDEKYVAKFVYESIDFERGNDPKDAMKIGRLANAVEIEASPYINPSEIIAYFKESSRDCGIMFKYYENGKKHVVTLSDLREEHPDIIFNGKYYDLRGNFVKESAEFRREADPKKALGIGNEEFRMISAVDKELKPMGFVKTGPADMGSQSDYMRSLEQWEKPGSPDKRETLVNLYFMNWYGIEKYQFSILANGYSIHFGSDATDWYDFERKWPNWTKSMEIIRMTDLKPGSIIKAKEKYAISSRLHEFRYRESDIRKKDYIIQKDEEIKIVDIDFNYPDFRWGIKVSFNNTYFICNVLELWERFEVVSLDNSVKESVSFQRKAEPYKSLEIGKYKSHIVKFKDYDGEIQTIKIQNNSFKLLDMDVRIEFKEDPDIGVSGDVYVDGQKSDINLFKIEPFDYEFKSQGEYADPGYTSYGMPIARDQNHLKELKEKHSYWTAMSGDYSRENKDPFAAAAQIILFTY